MKKKFIAAVLISVLLAALAGCHTVHGFGRDVESVGEAIQKGSK